MNITLKISDNTKEKMIEYFKEKKREKTPPYAVFQADEEDTVVTLYESGKVVFQGMSADVDANVWKEIEKNLNPNNNDIEITKDKKKEQKDENIKIFKTNIVGSDEVGTGDFFGPVVVTSCFVGDEDIQFLEELKVKDSKKLTDIKIMEIAPKIIKKIPSSTIILSNTDYNKYYSKDLNLNKIKTILHNRALILLTKKIDNYNQVVVDQFTTPRSYFNYLKDAKEVFRNITFITKAEDKCLSVACASIISRYYFITKINEISEDLKIVIPLGASDKVNEVAIEIIEKYGIEKLNEIAKLNFNNLKKIKEKMEF